MSKNKLVAAACILPVIGFICGVTLACMGPYKNNEEGKAPEYVHRASDQVKPMPAPAPNPTMVNPSF